MVSPAAAVAGCVLFGAATDLRAPAANARGEGAAAPVKCLGDDALEWDSQCTRDINMYVYVKK